MKVLLIESNEVGIIKEKKEQTIIININNKLIEVYYSDVIFLN